MKAGKKFAIVSACLLILGGCGGNNTVNTVVESSIESLNINDVTQPESASIAEGQILYEDNDLVITTDSIEADYESVYVVLDIQNNSEKPLSLVCESSTINGFYIDNGFTVDIDAGSETIAGMTYSNTALNMCGISEITDICFSLSAFTYEDYEFLFETPIMAIETDLKGSTEQAVNTAGTVIYDSKDFQLIGKGFASDGEDNNVLILMAVNNMAESVNISLLDGEAEIDGESCTSSFSKIMPANSKAIFTVYFLDSEGDPISQFETARAAFSLTNANTWKVIETTPAISFINSTADASADTDTDADTEAGTLETDGTDTDAYESQADTPTVPDLPDDDDEEVVPFNGVEYDPNGFDDESVAPETFDIDVMDDVTE